MGDVLLFPTGGGLEFSGQADRREFVLMAITGQPRVRQKRIILEAKVIGLLTDQDAQVFIDACSLGGA